MSEFQKPVKKGVNRTNKSRRTVKGGGKPERFKPAHGRGQAPKGNYRQRKRQPTDDSNPDHSNFDRPKPDYSKSDDRPKSGYSKSGYSKSDRSKSGYSKSDDRPKSGYSKSGYSKSDRSKSGYSKSGYSKPDRSKSGYSKPNHSRSRHSQPAPAPLTKAKVRLRYFLVLQALLRRELEGEYDRYFLDLPRDISPAEISLPVSSISLEQTRCYNNLSAQEKAQPMLFLVYPRLDAAGSITAVALGGIYPPSQAIALPEDLQPGLGYFTGKFVGTTALPVPESPAPESPVPEPSLLDTAWGQFEIAKQGKPGQRATHYFDLSQLEFSHRDRPPLDATELDPAQITPSLEAGQWVDLRLTLVAVGEQLKLAVREVLWADHRAIATGWNDPCYQEPVPESAEPPEVESPRRSWRRVERPIRKGRHKYQVR